MGNDTAVRIVIICKRITNQYYISIKKGSKVAYLDQMGSVNNDSRTVYEILSDSFEEIKVGPNAGQKAPKELVEVLQGESRIKGMDLDLTKPDFDVDVLVIGGGGAGSSAAIEANEAGANVMIVTKLRIGDANTMMAEGGIQAADKENDSPAQPYLDVMGG